MTPYLFPEFAAPQGLPTMFKLIASVVVVGGIAIGGLYVYPGLDGSRDGLPTIFAGEEGDSGALTYTVQPEDLLITVTEDGNVESGNNVEVKCMVKGGSTILWIVEDGSMVNEGDEIVKLDASQIEDNLNNQKITYERALATKIQAEENYAASVISVREYEEGTFIKELQVAEANIRIALENLRSAENVLQHTKKMARKGFVNSLQREADEFAVQRAQLELESMETTRKVLVEFTKEKTLKDLIATREANAAQMRSEAAAVELEESRLERLEKQLADCVITAPISGMVVYAADEKRQQPLVEEGAGVREGQVLINFPDIENMQVNVKIHESRVRQVTPGLRVRIQIEDKELLGHVVTVANQPEPAGWWNANLKEYSTTIAIDEGAEDLKPGMTAAVDILVAERTDVTAVPVSAVVEQAGRFFCWVNTSAGPQRRPLVLGVTNDKMIEVVDGVALGDVVLRNPRAVVEDARDDVAQEGEGRDASAFGESKDEDADSKESESDDKPDNKSGKDDKSGSAAAGGSGSGQRKTLLEYDGDGDGKVTEAELPDEYKKWFSHVDKNSDGFIDQQEADAAAKAAAAAVKASQQQQGGGQAGSSP